MEEIMVETVVVVVVEGMRVRGVEGSECRGGGDRMYCGNWVARWATEV